MVIRGRVTAGLAIPVKKKKKPTAPGCLPLAGRRTVGEGEVRGQQVNNWGSGEVWRYEGGEARWRQEGWETERLERNNERERGDVGK